MRSIVVLSSAAGVEDLLRRAERKEIDHAPLILGPARRACSTDLGRTIQPARSARRAPPCPDRGAARLSRPSSWPNTIARSARVHRVIRQIVVVGAAWWSRRGSASALRRSRDRRNPARAAPRWRRGWRSPRSATFSKYLRMKKTEREYTVSRYFLRSICWLRSGSASSLSSISLTFCELDQLQRRQLVSVDAVLSCTALVLAGEDVEEVADLLR